MLNNDGSLFEEDCRSYLQVGELSEGLFTAWVSTLIWSIASVDSAPAWTHKHTHKNSTPELTCFFFAWSWIFFLYFKGFQHLKSSRYISFVHVRTLEKSNRGWQKGKLDLYLHLPKWVYKTLSNPFRNGSVTSHVTLQSTSLRTKAFLHNQNGCQSHQMWHFKAFTAFYKVN